MITEEIRKGVHALFPEGSLVELRIPKSSYGTIIGFFRDREKLVQAIEEYSGKVPAVYYTLNAPAPELYDNTQLKDQANVGVHGCKDDEVMVRNWLLIDCDPIRIDGDGKPLADQKVSSTDAEKADALAVAKKVNLYLQEKEWPAPISADSGNGYHLLYNLGGMPSTPELTQTVEDALKHLAEKFNTETVKIDTVVSNPSRITKAYGSKAGKGAETESRPHRFSRIRIVGGTDPVTIMQLAALKPTPKEAKKSSIVVKAKAAEKYATTDGPEKMEEFLEWYEIAHKVMSREKNGYKWQIVPCPFNPEHNLGEVAVFVNDDGGYGFKCFHNSCAENHWQEFKNHLESISGKKFFWQTNVVTAAPLDAKPTTKMLVKRATSIAPEVLTWLWPNRIPFGKLTLFAGHPGVGKGMATMYIAACTSRGNGWHDCTNTNAPAEVVIVSSEDAAGDTLIPRLMAAEADMSKIFIVGGVTAEKGDKEFTLDTDIPALRQLLEDNPDIKVVIIDPIMNHLGQLKGNSEQEVRAGLSPLAKLAEKYGVAIVLVTHFNKSTNSDSIQRVGGAMGMVGSVRVAWTFGEDKEDGKMKMLPLKANIAPNTGGLEYKVVPFEVFINGQYSSEGRIQWGNETHASVDAAIKLKSKDDKQYAWQLAMTWLEEHLADGLSHPVIEVKKAAEYAGFKGDVLDTAATKLGVKNFQEEIPGAWFWQMVKSVPENTEAQ
jgi:putative DNA primase/helicase